MNNIYDKTKKVLGLSMAGAAVLPLVASCCQKEEKPQETPVEPLANKAYVGSYKLEPFGTAKVYEKDRKSVV